MTSDFKSTGRKGRKSTKTTKAPEAEVSDAVDETSVNDVPDEDLQKAPESADQPSTPVETPESDETPSEAGSEPSESTPDTMPPPAVAPASAQSSPEAAGATPASSKRRERAKPKTIIDYTARCQPDPFNIPNDPVQFKNMDEEVVEELTRYVPCQFIGALEGRINLSVQFKFAVGDLYMLPKWFALQYPTAIVVKE